MKRTGHGMTSSILGLTSLPLVQAKKANINCVPVLPFSLVRKQGVHLKHFIVYNYSND